MVRDDRVGIFRSAGEAALRKINPFMSFGECFSVYHKIGRYRFEVDITGRLTKEEQKQ